MLRGSVVGVVRGVRSLQDSVRRIGFQMCCRFGGQKCSKCVQLDLEKEKNKAKNEKRKTSRAKKREGVVMRMAKSPRECARAAGWMREIEARG